MTGTMEAIRELVTLVNAARRAAQLPELMVVNAIQPPGIAFLAATPEGALRQQHELPFNRKQAACYLNGQLAVLSELGD